MLSHPLTTNAINYTWRQLAQRVGISFPRESRTGFDAVLLPVFYGPPEQAQFDSPGLIIRRCEINAWEKLLFVPENSLNLIPVKETLPAGARMPIDDSVPVLFWGAGLEGHQWPFAERTIAGSVVFNVDILAASFIMLSRWEEMIIPTRDAHQRFPASASLAFKQGFLDRPLVDEYALILREWIRLLLPGWEPKKPHFSVRLSHDIDEIRRLPTAKTTWQAVGADLLKRRSPKLAAITLRGSFDPQNDPYYMGIYKLASISLEHGFTTDAFYFMTSGPGAMNGDYSLEEPRMHNTLDFLRQKGFEIGLHSGYDTFENLPLLKEEKSRLDHILGYSHYGGRQHFLRFKAPLTWRHWEAVGLEYDSSLGYADYEGFRCGTCFPYHPFDIAQDREINLEEVPLIVMDGTLVDYRKFRPGQGYDVIMKLARRCKVVQGMFTLLWHNSSLCGRFSPWVPIYERVVKELRNM